MISPEVFFNGPEKLLRTFVMTVCLYPFVVLVLRMSGKRTMAKMSGFELVVIAALGTTLADTVLNPDVSLAQGLLVYALLFFLQFILSWLSSRSNRVHNIVHHEPTLLFHDGQLLEDAMKRQRMTDEEVRAAVRGEGHARMEDVQAVILESDGNLSVIKKEQGVPTAMAPDFPLDGHGG